MPTTNVFGQPLPEGDPPYAQGMIMTEVDCPRCHETSHYEGNIDGLTVNCSVCDKPMLVRMLD